MCAWVQEWEGGEWGGFCGRGGCVVLAHLMARHVRGGGSCTSLLREGVGVGRRSVVEVGHRWELQGWLVCAEGDMSTAWWPRELLFESA